MNLKRINRFFSKVTPSERGKRPFIRSVISQKEGMKHILINSMFLLFAFLVSCKEQDQAEQSADNRKQMQFDLPVSIPSMTEFDSISTPNAPRRITRKIKKDKEGNLLFAAYEDIIRFDGKSFTSIPKQQGMDSFDAFDVLEDSKGDIWIASTHFGLFRANGESLTHFTTDDGLAHNRSMSVYEDKAGNIWIGGQGGASYYDGKSFRNFTTKEGLSHNDVNTIMEDRTGKIWFGTRGNLCVYDPSSSLMPAEKRFTEVRNDRGMPFTNVWSIIEDQKGNIWIGGQGLWRHNGSSFTKITTDFVTAVYEDKKGNIWTSSPDGVLSRYDPKSLLNSKAMAVQIFKGSGMFFGISEDKDGNIWVGTLRGVFRYDGNTINYFNDNKSHD
jgi:ligand-binding sensor domain-containing protein